MPLSADRLILIGDDVVSDVVLPAAHEYTLASIACCSRALRKRCHREAAARVKERCYLLDDDTVVTAGFLARLEVQEEAALAIKRRYHRQCANASALECVSTLRDLYSLDPLVLTRPNRKDGQIMLTTLIKERPTRCWTLHVLPSLGESFCLRHLADVREATSDEDTGVRGAAVIAMREACSQLKGDELTADTCTAFAQRLGDECETTRRTALASMARFSPRQIAEHQNALRTIIEDEAETDRVRLLARRAIDLAGLPTLD